jgi:hypothetical protein
MKRVSDSISIEHRNVRSVNLEREFLSPSPLDGFVASEQVLDGVRRFEDLFAAGANSRAWSITGPYGAGKSSFAHFLLALVGPNDNAAYEAAIGILGDSDGALSERMIEIRGSLKDSGRSGFVRAVATAEREPISTTVTRALTEGAETFWSGRPGPRPNVLREIESLADQEAGDVDPAEILRVLDMLRGTAPVLIVIDELGKALEYAADRAHDGDLYLLQQLAEYFSSSETMSGALIALQHLSFEDYAGGLAETRRHEWRKIQGRFEDVPFVGGQGHAARLIGSSIQHKGLRGGVARSMSRATGNLLAEAPELQDVLEALGSPPAGYPLHPTVIPALIELSGRYGQHDRSVMAFLTSEEPHALSPWMKSKEWGEDTPFFRLHQLYDYFVEGTSALGVTGEDAARLREIRNRLSEAVGLTDLESECLKTVGILNLVGRGGYRANLELVWQSVAGPDGSGVTQEEVRTCLEVMSAQGLLVYREFADEYRVWQGSDFDIAGALAREKAALSQEAVLEGPPVDHVNRVVPARPIVASRHSQDVGVLRYFETRYASRLDEAALTPSRPEADGLLLFVMDPEGQTGEMPAATADGRPLVALASRHVQGITDASIDATAALSVLENSKQLEHDVVARQEVRHRAAIAQATLKERIDAAFDPTRAGVECIARGARVRISRSRDLAELLSSLCDETYARSPRLRNEMLNRRELTSQGARTRRELIELMCQVEAEPKLGIEGHGPLRSLYDSVLLSTGIHRQTDAGWAFGPPDRESGIRTAWDRIEEFFDSAQGEAVDLGELYSDLNAPPYGMKDGPIPVLLVAALLVRREDVFVFEENSFLPRMNPEHFERLVKTPARFSVKRAAIGGIRAEVFRELQGLVGAEEATTSSTMRNATTLAVVRPLIGLLQRLPDYSKQTKRVSQVAQDVRTALLTTREPDELIFEALPRACGFESLGSEPAEAEGSNLSFVSTAKSALDELSGAYDVLLDKAADDLRSAFRCKGPADGLREDLRIRSRHLIEHVIDRRLRSFLLMATNQELEDREWLEAICTILAQKPPGSWKDSDLAVFESAVLETSRPFLRLELLHRQMDTTSRDGFSASRITLTRTDGTESGEVVMLEDSKKAVLLQIVEEALERGEELAGHDSAQGLLALLAEAVLTDSDARVSDPTESAHQDQERRAG